MRPLIGRAASELVDLASSVGAIGWKVNGAGGDGGSMVVLGPDDAAANTALRAAISASSGWRVIRAALGAGGVCVERQAERATVSPIGERVG